MSNTVKTTFGTITLTPAQKAVQTRRRNKLQAARTATANKAWATRRQNQARREVAVLMGE